MIDRSTVRVPPNRAKPNPMPGRRPIAFLLLGVLAYTVVTSTWQVERVPIDVHIAAIVVATTCMIPVIRWYVRGGQGLPMFELICLSYALQFSLPVYTQPNRIIVLSETMLLTWDSLFQTLLLVELGIIALMVGYYVGQRSHLIQSLPRLDLPLDPARRWIYLLGALSLGGLVALLQAVGWEPLTSVGVSAIVRLIAAQLNMAIIILAYETYSQPARRWAMALVLYALVALAFMIGLATGLLENALAPLVLLLVVRWHAKRRFPWLGVLLGIALYFALNPAKFEYRDQVWYSGERVSFTQRLDLWADLVTGRGESVFDLGAGHINDEPLREALARFDLVHKFVWVRELTPAIQPYYLGETYRYFLVSWIPRIVWPEKPMASAANELMDLDYRLKLEWQTSTIGVGQLPEAYANFGWPGVVAVMALQGLIFASLNAVLNGSRSEGGRAIYLSVMVYYLNGIGSSAVVLFGSLLQQILANALILRPFARSFQAKEPDTPTTTPAASPPAIAVRQRSFQYGKGTQRRR